MPCTSATVGFLALPVSRSCRVAKSLGASPSLRYLIGKLGLALSRDSALTGRSEDLAGSGVPSARSPALAYGWESWWGLWPTPWLSW